jgi:hypothetical protein
MAARLKVSSTPTESVAQIGVDSGKGQNDTLRVFAVPFHDFEVSVFVDAQITSNPAASQLNDPRQAGARDGRRDEPCDRG